MDRAPLIVATALAVACVAMAIGLAVAASKAKLAEPVALSQLDAAFVLSS